MYKNLETYIASGNSLESLILYDFKNESPWSDVNNEVNSLKKFLLYKEKKEPNFDCDGSNGTSPLASDLYNRLWGWSYEDRFHLPESLSDYFGMQWERMGSDTMNSFSTIYGHAKKRIYDDPNLADQNTLLVKFAFLTHTIGNFTLVPFQLIQQKDKLSFNQYRGFRGNNNNPYFVYDFFDLSLKLIQENTNAQVFKDYIETFFLNDYVDKDYSIVPLFKRHQLFLKEKHLSVENPSVFLPQNQAELNEYLSNVNLLIQKRSKRIVNELKKQISTTVEERNSTSFNEVKRQFPNMEKGRNSTRYSTKRKTSGKIPKCFWGTFSFVILWLVLSCISVASQYQEAGGASAIIEEYGYTAFINDFKQMCLLTVKDTFFEMLFFVLFALLLYALFLFLRFLAKKYS